MKNSGMFITFEGTDKAGKSTQIDLFCKYLNEKKVQHVYAREPGGCIVSERIRGLILDPELDISPVAELFLYNSARAELVAKVIGPALKQGKTIVCDRYVDSSVAYQGYGRELGAEYVLQICNAATNNLTPDLTFWLDINQQTANERMQTNAKDRLESTGQDFYARVHNGYKQIYDQDSKKDIKRVVRIDAQASIEDIHAQIISAYQERI